MRDTSCRREDIIAAFEDLCCRLEERRTSLWSAYGSATTDLAPREYEEFERECWQVLSAGLAGVDAERRMLERDFERRLSMLDSGEAVA